jgi:hypothetical protein
MLSVPPEMEAVLKRADAELCPLDEVSFSGAMRAAAPEAKTIREGERRGAFAEWAAWNFMRPHGVMDTEREPWGIYWSPLFGAVTQDGRNIHNPDVDEIENDTLSHWGARAGGVVHPAIRARYADLAWEIGRYRKRPAKDRESSKPPVTVDISFTLAQTAIDGYLDAIERDLVERDFAAWMFLDRAIALATALKDKGRTARAKGALFAFYRKKAADGARFSWARLNDLTEVHGKPLLLTEGEEREVIQSLEDALAKHSAFGGSDFDPHQASDAADRLARRLADKPEEVRRVVKQAGMAFEEAAKGAAAILAIAWLEDLIPRYRNVGLLEEAARIERAIRDRAQEARGEMKAVSHTVEIPKDKMDAWVNAVLGSNVREALARIAFHCMMKEDDMRKTVADMVEHAPLSAMMPITVMGADGFKEATIRSVEDDLDGRAIKQAADAMQLNQLFLHNAFVGARQRYGLDEEKIINFLNEAPFFAPTREPLLHEGLAAWAAQDAIKAIHVLVPQVEAACRDLLQALGASVRRLDPHAGGFEVIGMGAVVNHQKFRAGVPKDMRFSLRAFYCDPRGINLRNHLAHGMAHIGLFNMSVANWVVHSLLMLGMLRLNASDQPGAGAGQSA